MTKEEFARIIELVLKQDKLLDTYSDFIRYDSDFASFGFLMFDKLIEAIFDTEGEDWISWWLWERSRNDKAFDKDGNVIPTETVDDLWELVKNYVK